MNLNILIMAANFVESSFLHQALIQVASALGSTPYMPQAVRILEENQPYVFIASYLFLAVTQYFCEKTKAIKIGSEQKVFIIFNDKFVAIKALLFRVLEDIKSNLIFKTKSRGRCGCMLPSITLRAKPRLVLS